MLWVKWCLAGTGAMLVIAGIGLILAGADRSLYRKPWQALERPRRVEWFIYRHHRLFGGVIATGALLLLVLLATYHGRIVEASAWRSSFGAHLALIAVWIFAAFPLIVGIYIFIRPSALKGFEAMANRWIEPFPATVFSVAKFNNALLSTPKRSGMLFLLAGIVCLLAATKMAAT